MDAQLPEAQEFLVSFDAEAITPGPVSLYNQTIRMAVSNQTTIEAVFPRRTASLWDFRKERNRVYVAVTSEQYDQQKDSLAQTIQGPLQVGSTTQDTLNALSYNLQKNKVETAADDTMVVTWSLSTMNAMLHQADQRISFQSYWGVTTLVRIHEGKRYNLDPQENATLVIFKLRQFNPIVYQDEYSLQKGFTWARHRPLQIRVAILVGTISPQLKGIIEQSLRQTTLSKLRFLPIEAQMTVITYMSLNDFVIPTIWSDNDDNDNQGQEQEGVTQQSEDHNDAPSPTGRTTQVELQLLPNGLLRLQELPADDGYIEGVEMLSVPITRR